MERAGWITCVASITHFYLIVLSLTEDEEACVRSRVQQRRRSRRPRWWILSTTGMRYSEVN